mmetsp:Transcript_58213/g.142808  ORF Transcript_58213/g.142808 Transcript_58213/m.142808 type:complete len:145 (+) Transcript_58213:214-648(+)
MMKTVRQSVCALVVAAALLLGQASATATPALRTLGQRPQMAFSTAATGLVEVGGVRPDSLSSSALGPERTDSPKIANTSMSSRKSSYAQLPQVPRQASSVSMSMAIQSEPLELSQSRPAAEVRQDSHGFAWVPIGVRRYQGQEL